MRTKLLSIVSLCVFAGCVSPPTSPWEITVQLERRVELLEGATSIAVRADDLQDPAVLINVQCTGEDRTIRVAKLEETEEICGVSFELSDLIIRSAEATGASLIVRWEEESE